MLSLTGSGRDDLLRRLKEPADHDISDSTRYFTILAFLSLLPDVADQHAVLRRRLEFLERPASFFCDGDRPLRAGRGRPVPPRHARHRARHQPRRARLAA